MKKLQLDEEYYKKHEGLLNEKIKFLEEEKVELLEELHKFKNKQLVHIIMQTINYQLNIRINQYQKKNNNKNLQITCNINLKSLINNFIIY